LSNDALASGLERLLRPCCGQSGLTLETVAGRSRGARVPRAAPLAALASDATLGGVDSEIREVEKVRDHAPACIVLRD